MESLISSYFANSDKHLMESSSSSVDKNLHQQFSRNIVSGLSLAANLPPSSGFLVPTPIATSFGHLDESQGEEDKNHTGRNSSSPNLDSEIHKVFQVRIAKLQKERDQLRASLRDTEETLSLAQAKKTALKKANAQLLQERNSLIERFQIFHEETSLGLKESQYWKDRATEAVKELTGIRESHLQEVRLLQRALLAAGGRAQFKLTDTAELVEKLGRSVIQRDEALREKTKLQNQLHLAKKEFFTILSDRNKVTRQATLLSEKMEKVTKINNTLIKQNKMSKPVVEESYMNEVRKGSEDEYHDGSLIQSDSLFAKELSSLEKVYAVLGEGTAGVEHQVRVQSEDILSQRLKLSRQEDDLIFLREELQRRENAVKRKEEEINRLLHENASLETRLHAAADAEAEAVIKCGELEKALTIEQMDLKKMTEDCTAMQEDLIKGASEEVVQLTVMSALEDIMGIGLEIVRPVMLATHTGEVMEISIVKKNDKKGIPAVFIRALDPETSEAFMLQLDKEKVEEIRILGGGLEEDEQESWLELMYSVGFTSENNLVLPTLVVTETAFLPPAELPLVLKVFKYDETRYYVSGFDDILQRLVDLRIELKASEHIQAVHENPRWITRHLLLEENHDTEALLLHFSLAPTNTNNNDKANK